MSAWGQSDSGNSWSGGGTWGQASNGSTWGTTQNDDSFGEWGIQTMDSRQAGIKPQVQILKRKEEDSEKDKTKQPKQSSREDYKTREQRYLLARQKIFGQNDRSATNSPEPPASNGDKTVSNEPKRTSSFPKSTR